jgi:hypothetical protein
MLVGLLLQAAGLAGVAILARQHAPLLELAPLLTASGSGTAMVFPTVANEVMASASSIAAAFAPTSRTTGGRALDQPDVWPVCRTHRVV